MKFSLQRKILQDGVITPVEFNTTCGKWLVKNLSDNDLYVSFEADLNENEAIKIQKGMGQIVIVNEQLDWTNTYKSNTIYLKGNGEVEVQQLCYQ